MHDRASGVDLTPDAMEMIMNRLRILIATLAVAVFSTALALAQMSGGQTTGGHQGTHNMQNMSPAMTAAQQLMRSVDMRMTSAGTQMHELATAHAGMGSGGSHDQMVSSMQGFLDQMRRVHDGLNSMSKGPMMGLDKDMMKSFEQACRDLDQMAKSFESMARNLTRTMKGANASKK